MRFKQMQHLSTILSATILLFLINPAFAISTKDESSILSSNPPQEISADYQPDLLIKSYTEPDTAYQTDNVYQQVPSDQQVKTIDSLKGNPVTFQVKLQNDSDAAQSYYLKTVESADNGWTVNYDLNDGSRIIDTLAGGDTGTNYKLCSLYYPKSIAFDKNGDLYIGDDYYITHIDSHNMIYRVTGNGTSGFSGDDGLAKDASISNAAGITFDADNNLYFTDCGNQRVRRIDAKTGIITTIAGNGNMGFSGDGGLATNASLNLPFGIAMDASGNIYVSDYGNNRIRKIDAVTKNITTISGTSSKDYDGDGILASHANLYHPEGIAIDSSDNLYIAEPDDNRVRKIESTTGLIQTIAGNGLVTHTGDGGPATQASLRMPGGICLDKDSNIYISGYAYIRKIAAKTGIITTIAGNGTSGFSGDGGPAVLAELIGFSGIAVKSDGSIYIADCNNHRVRMIESATAIQDELISGGYATDAIPAHGSIVIDITMTPDPFLLEGSQKSVILKAYTSSTETQVSDSVEAIAHLPIFRQPDLLIKRQADPDTSYSGDRIYQETPAGMQILNQNLQFGEIAHFCAKVRNNGDQAQSFLLKSIENKIPGWTCSYSRNGEDITTDLVGNGYTTPVLNPGENLIIDVTEIPSETAIGSAPEIIIVNAYNDINDTTVEDSIKSITIISVPDLLIKDSLDPDSAYQTANLYQPTPNGKQIKTVETISGNPANFTIKLQNNSDAPQSYYLKTKESADTGWTVNYTLDDSSRIITTFAGGGYSTADGVDAKQCYLNNPYSVAFDNDNNLYVGLLQYIRKISTSGEVYKVAGSGGALFSGDGGLAINASILGVYGIAFDKNNNLYFTDCSNQRVRRIDAETGIITTIAGNGSHGFSGDGSLATDASLNLPYGIAIDASGNIFISDYGNNRIRKIDASTQIISTYAGTGGTVYNGDGIAASNANIGQPCGIALDLAGNLYITDHINHRIRRVDSATGIMTTIAGNGSSALSGDGGLATQAGVPYPLGICLDKGSNVYVSEMKQIREINTKTGIITTIAGNGSSTLSGDSGPAVLASMNAYGITTGSDGSIYIVDINNMSIRKVESATAIQDTLASSGYTTSVIPAHGSIVINAVLTPNTSLAVGFTKSVVFEAYSGSNDSNVIDSVEAVAQVAASGTYSSPTGLIQGGWNLISLPTDPVNADPLSVFAGIDVANSSFQYWDNTADPCMFQGYGSAIGWTGPAVRGVPYWFIQSSNSSEVTLSYQGIEPTTDFVMTVPAHTSAPYWIMVGTPFPSSVSADAVLFKDTSKRGDNWLTWSDAYSNTNSALRVVDSSMQGWDASQNTFVRLTPSDLAATGDKTQFDPWWGYWLLVMDKSELQIKFPKPAQ